LGVDQEFEELDSQPDHPVEAERDYADVNDRPGTSIHDIDYQDLSDTPAFRWLIAMIKREHLLDQAGLVRMRKFSQSVLDVLPPEQMISRRKAQLYRVKYVIEWDLISFLEEQRYDVPIGPVLEAVIVLTGNMGDAQATTCGEYLKQTWPTTGSFIINLLIEVVRQTRAECIPSHQSTVDCRLLTVYRHITRPHKAVGFI
jgi:hypothetical protein